MKNFSTSDPLFSRNLSLNLDGRIMDLSTPRIMGIINATPDSFYSGSRLPAPEEAVKIAGRMIEQGADILDVGAVSSRPGAEEISNRKNWNGFRLFWRPSGATSRISHFGGYLEIGCGPQR